METQGFRGLLAPTAWAGPQSSLGAQHLPFGVRCSHNHNLVRNLKAEGEGPGTPWACATQASVLPSHKTKPGSCRPALTFNVWALPVTAESMILPAWFTVIPARSGSAMAEEILLAGS